MTSRRILLSCGILSSLVYVFIDLVAAIRYGEYHSFTSRAISELMASGAPTERLVDPLFLLYDALVIAFGVGVWRAAGPKRLLHLVGGLFVAYGLLGLLGPTLFEMKVRGTGGDTSQDLAHIALTGVIVLIILVVLGIGAFVRGRGFRFYSFATILVLLVTGALTSLEARHLAAGEPTPWLGLLERINIGAFLLWVLVLAVSLLRSERATDPSGRRDERPGDLRPTQRAAV